jgi:hypothetical protein
LYIYQLSEHLGLIKNLVPIALLLYKYTLRSLIKSLEEVGSPRARAPALGIMISVAEPRSLKDEPRSLRQSQYGTPVSTSECSQGSLRNATVVG